MCLLDGVDRYGFGNWNKIAKHVGSKFRPTAVKNMYINTFVNGVIGKHTWGEVAFTNKIVENISDDTKDLGKVKSTLKPLDITSEEATELDYLRERDEFVSIYDKEADHLTSIASSITEESNFDRALKLSVMDIHMRRKREREGKELIIRDYQLVAKHFRPQDQDVSEEHKKMSEDLRSFCQFYTSDEYEQLVSGLVKEKQLRFRILELMRYRALGLKTMDECLQFEQGTSKEEAHAQREVSQRKTDNFDIPDINKPSTSFARGA